MAKAKKETLPELACPRCGYADTVPLRNYDRPMAGETPGTSRWRRLQCHHRFDGPKVPR